VKYEMQLQCVYSSLCVPYGTMRPHPCDLLHYSCSGSSDFSEIYETNNEMYGETDRYLTLKLFHIGIIVL